MQKEILDYIEMIEIDWDNPPINNLHALKYLPQGIINLANYVSEAEAEMQTELKPVLSMDFTSHKVNFLACIFTWFAISVVNYVRLIALIDIMTRNGWETKDLKTNTGKIKNYCDSYLKKVVPDIYCWRNKVAAHFAATDPYINDNLGTLEMSIMQPITYIQPYYFVSAGKLSINGEQGTIPEWSLTKEFEKLQKRFWPQLI